MIPPQNFETLSFNPFDNEENILLNDNSDPDKHLFTENDVLKINEKFYSVNETKTKLGTKSNNCSFLFCM